MSTETTLVYVVRHGETEWNAAGRQQGHRDSVLTEIGIKQAHLLAGSLHGRGIQALYSSDLGRAVQTGEILGAALGLELKADSRLREQHLGLIQGLTQDEFREQFPEKSALLDVKDFDYDLLGGESRQELAERCVDCIHDLTAWHPGKRVLVVAHGGVLNCLFHYALGLDWHASRRFSLFNTALNSFSITGHEWRLETWGDRTHLQGLRSLDDT